MYTDFKNKINNINFRRCGVTESSYAFYEYYLYFMKILYLTNIGIDYTKMKSIVNNTSLGPAMTIRSIMYKPTRTSEV